MQVGRVSGQGQADAFHWGWEGSEEGSGDERGGLGSSKVDGKPAAPHLAQDPSPPSSHLAEVGFGDGDLK